MTELLQPTIQSSSRTLRGVSLALVVMVYCLFTLALFHDTAADMVRVWCVSETFAHGFLIVPISLWLVWRDRVRIRFVPARPQPWILLFSLLGGVAWLLARLVDVSVVEQVAFVGILVSGIVALLGVSFARHIAFPLGFLLMAVPMGEGLVPHLVELTADTTELLVRGSGIPVYREGTFLTLPTGLWSVVDACSGVRYLIASFTLGLVYAYLTYQTTWKRLAFVATAIVLPIIANSLRAYGIVMIGHFSGMELAVGVDHLIYGWVFFGLVMFLLFWVGSFWREDETVAAAEPAFDEEFAGKRSLLWVALLVVATAFAPVLLWGLSGEREADRFDVLTELVPQGEWVAAIDPGWTWLPRHIGADRSSDQYVRENGATVGVYLRQHLQQVEGSELVQAQESWQPDHGQWRVLARSVRHSGLEPHQDFSLHEALVQSKTESLLVWNWYRVGGRYTNNPYVAKLLEGLQTLQGRNREGTRIFVATPTGEDPGAARAVLRRFLDENLVSLEDVLDDWIASGS